MSRSVAWATNNLVGNYSECTAQRNKLYGKVIFRLETDDRAWGRVRTL